MTFFTQLIHEGAWRQPTADLSSAGRGQGASNAESSSTPTTPVAFGDLFDLMRFSNGTAHGADVCEDCNTLNRRGACYCKTCMRKLPAYYTAANAGTPFVIWRRRERKESRSGAWDLAAVWVVLTSLVLMTAYIPVG
ncbi:hypothetical protein WKW77_18635 [Variovorax ureilyticus]|uniref:Uncharacterized protein n=1 Tax=Variovorax ureilyticus TaxID=1836198 RepID=A0ABU8VJB1_9BURK